MKISRLAIAILVIMTTVLSIFTSCKKENDQPIPIATTSNTVNSSNSAKVMPIYNFHYFGAPASAKFLVYNNSGCSYGELRKFVSGVLVPEGISITGTPSFTGYCTINSSACDFVGGATVSSWGPFYYIYPSVKTGSGSTQILRIRIKQGANFGFGYPTFIYYPSTNNWTINLLPSVTNIEASVVTSMPQCPIVVVEDKEL
jgi:hypothetical protein